MAITVGDLAVDLRIATAVDAALPAAQTAILSRLLATAQTLVTERAGGAPESLRDQAVLAVASYMYDRPSAGAGNRYANAWASSGASELLSRYVARRARVIGGPTATATGTGVDTVEVNRLIALWISENFNSAGLPMPATPAEAAGGISTTIRSWTAALIRRAIDARVARIEQRLDALENG